MQNKKRIMVIKPKRPLVITLVRMPLPEITLVAIGYWVCGILDVNSYLAFFVSSATCPAASNPTIATPVKTL
jgi:hypothetical protein